MDFVMAGVSRLIETSDDVEGPTFGEVKPGEGEGSQKSDQQGYRRTAERNHQAVLKRSHELICRIRRRIARTEKDIFIVLQGRMRRPPVIRLADQVRLRRDAAQEHPQEWSENYRDDQNHQQVQYNPAQEFLCFSAHRVHLTLFLAGASFSEKDRM